MKHIVKKLSTQKQKKHIHINWKGWIISIYENSNSMIEVTAYPYVLAKNTGVKDHYTYLNEHLTKDTMKRIKDNKLYISGPKATYVKLSKKQYYPKIDLEIIVDALKFRLPDVIEFK